MAYTSSLYSMGGVSYDIVAVDRTKEAVDSANQGVDSVGVHYSDTLSDIAFNFNNLKGAAEGAYQLMQAGFNETIGVAEAYQDQLDDMHNMFGVTIEDAQKWRSATIATDTEMGSLMVTMRYVSQRVTDTSEAGEKYRKTLADIGVEVKDHNGKYKDTSTLMKEILVGLEKIPEGSERAGAAADVLGRNWYRVADMVNNADVAVKTFKETSPGITDDDSERIEKFKIKWALLSEKIELAKVNLGLWIIDSAEAQSQMEEENPSYLDQWLNSTFGDKSKATSGAGGRKGTTEIEDDAVQDKIMKNFKDQYAGLTDIQIEIGNVWEEYNKYTNAMKTDTTQEQFDKDAKGAQTAKNKLEELNATLNNHKEQISAQVEAYKDYEAEIKSITSTKKNLYDLDKDYYDEMQSAGSDVAAARAATKRYISQKDKLSGKALDETISAQEDVTRYNEIASGTPLEKVKGTSQYIESQVKSTKSLSIGNIYVTLSKDYPATTFLEDLQQQRISQGIQVTK